MRSLAAVAAGVAAAMAARAAAADPADAAILDRAETFVAKKDRMLAATGTDLGPSARRAWHQALDERVGEEPPAVLNVRNLWTDEILVLPRDPEIEVGEDIAGGLVDRFLRCHFTHQPTDMDARLVEVLVRAADKFGTDRIEVISGFRSPKYNLTLRKKGHEVARNSQHTHGTAVDFRVPGVPVRRLYRWARSLRLGGVGYYPHSGFIHVDTAEVRTWSGR